MIDPLARRSAAIGWLASMAIHAALLALASTALTPPDTGFEFQAPERIELGFVEATEVHSSSSGPPPDPEAPSAADPTSEQVPGQGIVVVPSRPDAGPRRRRRPDAGADAGSADAGVGIGLPVAFLPPGAQIALRIDLDRIRSSPVGEDVRSLLRAIPDWQALLGPSGIDPVRDLSRILVATPDLQRASLVVAGRLAPEAPDPRAIVESAANASGVPVAWHEESGVPTTRWPSLDETMREVALIGARHFVIARPEDLPRVLAIAASPPRLRHPSRQIPAPEGPAEALLAMGEGEGVSLEIENVPVFVRRSPCAVPLRMRLGLVETPDGVAVRGEARFASTEEATSARSCLAERARATAQSLFVVLYGLHGPLERLDLSAEDTALRMETLIRYVELRTVLALVRGWLERPAPQTPPSLQPPPRTPIPPTPPNAPSPPSGPSPRPIPSSPAPPGPDIAARQAVRSPVGAPSSAGREGPDTAARQPARSPEASTESPPVPLE
jgi:hypothetical protein